MEPVGQHKNRGEGESGIWKEKLLAGTECVVH